MEAHPRTPTKIAKENRIFFIFVANPLMEYRATCHTALRNYRGAWPELRRPARATIFRCFERKVVRASSTIRGRRHSSPPAHSRA